MLWHMEVRLNKYLAEKGVASRREAEKLIEQGAVKVNGKVITVQGVKIDPACDIVEVSDQALAAKKEALRVYALYKPLGYVCSTHATRVEKNIVTDLLKTVPVRVYPVGRLDKDTTGLLIMTNDGELAFELTHPKFEHSKKYLVETAEPLAEGALNKLRKGVSLFGEKTLPAEIENVSRTQFLITIREGKNRQIRRIVRKVGGRVKSLCRVQIGTLKLADLGLSVGKFRELSIEEVRKLRGLKTD